MDATLPAAVADGFAASGLPLIGLTHEGTSEKEEKSLTAKKIETSIAVAIAVTIGDNRLTDEET